MLCTRVLQGHVKSHPNIIYCLQPVHKASPLSEGALRGRGHQSQQPLPRLLAAAGQSWERGLIRDMVAPSQYSAKPGPACQASGLGVPMQNEEPFPWHLLGFSTTHGSLEMILSTHNVCA